MKKDHGRNKRGWAVAVAVTTKIKCKYDTNRSSTNLNLFNSLKLNRCPIEKKTSEKFKKGVPHFFYALTIQMIYY